MTPASTNAQGRCTTAKDVCSLPPAEPACSSGEDLENSAPYLNVADNREVLPSSASSRVRIENMLSAVDRTLIPQSSGNEPGEATGVANAVRFGASRYINGSCRVYFEGSRAAYHGALTDQNGHANPNAPVGGQTSPSQAKVFLNP